MTKQYLTIIFLAALLKSYGQSKCSCGAIIDVEYCGEICLFKNPNGELLEKVRHNIKDQGYLGLTIINDSANFFLVDIALPTDNIASRGWIKKSKKIGTYARNYSSGTLKLFSDPDSNSIVQTVVPEYTSELYVIKKCSRKWVFVTLNYKGHSYKGWLQPDQQCPSPYSTCN